MPAASAANAPPRARSALGALGLSATLLACASSAPRPARELGEPAAPSSNTAAAEALDAELADAPPSHSTNDVAHATAADTAAPPPVSPPAPLPPVRVAVPGDRPVLVLEGAASTSRALLYFHGKCGDPEGFRAWAPAAHRVGTLISMLGDIPCKGGGRTRWSTNPRSLDARVRAAVAAVEAATGRRLDAPPIVFGYSQGALVAEALATRWPERYPRVVLAAGPRAPRSPRLGELAAVLLVAGELDTRHHLIDAANKLVQRGVRARYLELPGAKHGQYGPEAEAQIAAGLDWLLGLEKL